MKKFTGSNSSKKGSDNYYKTRCPYCGISFQAIGGRTADANVLAHIEQDPVCHKAYLESRKPRVSKFSRSAPAS